MASVDQRPAHRCMLVRVINRTSLCLVLHETQAVILAQLAAPLSPRSMVNAQLVHAFKPVPASVRLGRYDVSQHRFTDCEIEAQLPEANYSRLAYGSRREEKKWA